MAVFVQKVYSGFCVLLMTKRKDEKRKDKSARGILPSYTSSSSWLLGPGTAQPEQVAEEDDTKRRLNAGLESMKRSKTTRHETKRIEVKEKRRLVKLLCLCILT